MKHYSGVVPRYGKSRFVMIDITVAITAHPPRLTNGQLLRALTSVMNQTMQPSAITTTVDLYRQGAAITRNRAWRMADTSYIAFLDSDDEFLSCHLECLAEHAIETDADFLYPWFEVKGGTDPFPDFFGKEWDPSSPHQTTITGLWKKSALEKIDGFPEPGNGVDAFSNRAGEDYLAVRNLNDMNGKIVHIPARTWIWHHHHNNTSGLSDRW